MLKTAISEHLLSCCLNEHLWTILTFHLISRISEFTYRWSDNPHPVFMDESNGFCNGMEIIQTCQWSDVIFCTRSDSKWVSRHCSCMVWMTFWAYFCQWECDFLEAKISFITFSVSELTAKCSDHIKVQ